jgi:hypothetical protein
MARILKNNRTYPNPFDGAGYSTAYLMVDDLQINKREKSVRFTVEIYASKQARIDSRSPLAVHRIEVGEPNFSTYFSTAQNTKIWNQVYDYLDAVPIPGVVADDWKKDPDAEL